MGKAMLKGWLGQGMAPTKIMVVEQNAHALDGIPTLQCPLLARSLDAVELIKEPVSTASLRRQAHLSQTQPGRALLLQAQALANGTA